ncbi:hypothetical protein [Amnibacterium soli]|uniref:hypothetical protein n=1 Tax=Amnibacterium soli TaxID=1282736 RepID=UPI0031ED896C
MVDQRDPARYGISIVSGGLNVIIWLLFAVPTDGDAFLRIIGVVLFVLGVVTLAIALRGFRRERSRTD